MEIYEATLYRNGHKILPTGADIKHDFGPLALGQLRDFIPEETDLNRKRTGDKVYIWRRTGAVNHERIKSSFLIVHLHKGKSRKESSVYKCGRNHIEFKGFTMVKPSSQYDDFAPAVTALKVAQKHETILMVRLQ